MDHFKFLFLTGGFCFKIQISGRTSLAIQQLKFHASNAEGTDEIPGQEAKIPHAAQCGQQVETSGL